MMNKDHDGYRSYGSGEDYMELIEEGFEVLAEDNPLVHVIIDVKENFDGEKHPHSTFEVDMVNLT